MAYITVTRCKSCPITVSMTKQETSKACNVSLWSYLWTSELAVKIWVDSSLSCQEVADSCRMSSIDYPAVSSVDSMVGPTLLVHLGVCIDCCWQWTQWGICILRTMSRHRQKYTTGENSGSEGMWEISSTSTMYHVVSYFDAELHPGLLDMGFWQSPRAIVLVYIDKE